MKKKIIEFSVMLVIVFFIVPIFACSHQPSPYAFDYPDGISPKYCLQNYLVFDPNIRYTECYEFMSTKDKTGMISGLAHIDYSAIKGSDDLSFLVCYKIIHWFGENRFIHIVKEKNCDINPITDYSVSNIEICTCTFEDFSDIYPNVEECPEAYYKYAENSLSDPIITVTSPDAVSEILNVAKRPAIMTREENTDENKKYLSSYKYQRVIWQGKPVFVKISFEECEGLVWLGQLLTDDDGHAYMERSTYILTDADNSKETALAIKTDFASPFKSSFGYPLGEKMDVILSELINQSQ